MRKFLLSLAVATAFIPSVAFGFSAPEHEARTGIASAFVAGKLDARLVEIHTDHFSSPWKLDRAAWQANVDAVRRFATCALDRANCRAARPTNR